MEKAPVGERAAGPEVDPRQHLAMPVSARLVVMTVVSLMGIAGLYLIAVRGEALLLDLGKLAAMCF
ncbi:MAG: hypothetical protein AAFO75_06695 [Pseudomonadota bacterium]